MFVLNNFSAWVWNAARNDMFDYIPIVTDKMVLAIMKQGVQRGSWDIFLRPFQEYSWIMVTSTTVTLLLGVQILSYLYDCPGKNAGTFKKVHRFAVFITWVFFLIIEIHYEGALTMFFTTEVEVPFHSIKDVMKEAKAAAGVRTTKILNH